MKICLHLFAGDDDILRYIMLKLRRDARIERHAGKVRADAVFTKPVIDEIDSVVNLIPEGDAVVSPNPNLVRADLNQRFEHLIAGEELIAQDGDEGFFCIRFHILPQRRLFNPLSEDWNLATSHCTCFVYYPRNAMAST
ncbi:hypothetical protein SDC9_128583 [bioreactor metagenome]|uniref:Uncharacterized protein n=1 Tax=bioreactor metagenome TaxID=1076179 RepID=A0A645CX90_9ZZZZ